MDWKKKYAEKIVTYEEAAKKIRDGDHVMFSQSHGEARNLLKAIINRKDELRDVVLMTHLHWGHNYYAQPGMEKAFQLYSNFLSGPVRDEYAKGNVEFLPLYFFDTANYYETIHKPDVALLTLSEPDEEGFCSFGLSAEYSVALANGAKKIIAHINPSYPRTYGEKVHLDKLTWIVYQDEEVEEAPTVSVVPKPEDMAIGKLIADQVPDGATLQMGIGAIPDSILIYLREKEHLGIHTEMYSDGAMELQKLGNIDNSMKKIDVGKTVMNFIAGSKNLMDYCNENPDILMRGVGYTNNPYVIAQNDNVISINACLQVNLWGEVASDYLNDMPYSGVGGQVDFVRGAKMSKGGKSIIAMRSTAKKGTISTIVSRFPWGTPVTVNRYDVHYICTEHGIVNLHGLTVSQRVRALIELAAPEFREQLEKEAYEYGILRGRKEE
ncbi:MAG: acetyl-CoA hydrolase/transferase family protein [Lachnospiraceae bacterium]